MNKQHIYSKWKSECCVLDCQKPIIRLRLWHFWKLRDSYLFLNIYFFFIQFVSKSGLWMTFWKKKKKTTHRHRFGSFEKCALISGVACKWAFMRQVFVEMENIVIDMRLIVVNVFFIQINLKSLNFNLTTFAYVTFCWLHHPDLCLLLHLYVIVI